MVGGPLDRVPFMGGGGGRIGRSDDLIHVYTIIVSRLFSTTGVKILTFIFENLYLFYYMYIDVYIYEILH